MSEAQRTAELKTRGFKMEEIKRLLAAEQASKLKEENPFLDSMAFSLLMAFNTN